VLFVVPEQATFIAERRLYAQLGVAERVEVLSFHRLAGRIFEELGGLGQSYLTMRTLCADERGVGILRRPMTVYGRHTSSRLLSPKRWKRWRR
jgi:hypothetical protein